MFSAAIEWPWVGGKKLLYVRLMVCALVDGTKANVRENKKQKANNMVSKPFFFMIPLLYDLLESIDTYTITINFLKTTSFPDSYNIAII